MVPRPTVVIFVAGLSGSGKTVAASASGVATIIPLDSFFFDERSDLPKWLGRTDWETIRSFNLDAAVSAVVSLAAGNSVDVPIYDHYQNAAVGSTLIAPSGNLVAEGVYAPAVYDRVVREGVSAALLLVDVPAEAAFKARMKRDIGERHMNVVWAIVRSARLFVRHGRYRTAAVARGAELIDRGMAPQRIADLAARPTHLHFSS
jgi:uridine kinase